jgi:hypothetical protein
VEEFSIGGAWRDGYQFLARGFLVEVLILLLIGIAAPLGLQYALLGEPMSATSSPMTAGSTMLQMADAATVLIVIALSHMLQVGSFFGALRFGYSGARSPVAALGFGLAAGLIALLIIAAGYAIAMFGAQAIASPETVELAVLVLVLPLLVVYALFFISQAILAAATIVSTLLFLFVYGLINGVPELAAMAFGGSGLLTVMMLVLSVVLFWLAARFSCVTALVAERRSLNIFAAIRDSWTLTADEQGAIFRYLALIGFSTGILAIATMLAIGAGLGGLVRAGGGLAADGTVGLILNLLFGIPLAILSVMLPAGIYRQLRGEETPSDIFE